MSLSQIEAELDHLTPDELRRLAMKSRDAFVQKEGCASFNECDEEDPALLRALDRSIAKADAASNRGLVGSEVRARLEQWVISK